MILRVLAFVPLLLVTAPWALTRLLDGRRAVVVITGMLPPDMGPEAFVLGPATLASQLAFWVLAPPLAAFAIVYALPFRRARAARTGAPPPC